jgi:DICT domain-containing protein
MTMPPMPQADELLQTPPADIASSVYWQLAKRPHVTSYRLSKATLIALSWAIEDQFCTPAESPLLFGAFQRPEFFRPARARWEHLAATAAHAMVFAEFDDGIAANGPTPVRLRPDSPLAQEWVIVCDSRDLPVVLAAWEIPGQTMIADRDRIFQAVWTMEPEAVRLASRVCAQVAADSGVEEAKPVLYALADNPPPAVIGPAEASALFSRVIAYLDRFGPVAGSAATDPGAN